MKRELNKTILSRVRKHESPYDRMPPYDINDTQCMGLTLRVEKGGLYWWFRYRRPSDGKQTRWKICDETEYTLKEVRNLAWDARRDVRNGVDPAGKKGLAEIPTLREFIEGEYGTHIRHQRTFDATVKTLLREFKPLLDKRLDEVDARGVERIRSLQRDRKLKPRSINRYYDMMRACMATAHAFRLIEEDKLSGMKALKVNNRKPPRILSEDEMVRLVASMRAREERKRLARENRNRKNKNKLPPLDGTYADHLVPMVCFSLATGVRRKELTLIEWGDFDLAEEGREALTLRPETTKNGEEHCIALNSMAVEIIKRWREQTKDIGVVFLNPRTGKPFKDISASFNRVVKEAGIENFSWHKLRSTFASHQLRVGGAPLTVKWMLDHSSLQTTEKHYLSQTPDHVREDAKKMGSLLGNILKFPAARQ